MQPFCFFVACHKGTSFSRGADFVKVAKNASIQILYLKNIYNGTICLCLYFIKNAVLHKAYPKDIRFFYANKKFLYKLKYYHYSLIYIF